MAHSVLTASRLIVTPGFIDPHIHGAGGVDVMDGTYESLNAVSRVLVQHGTTSFLPTTVSSPPEALTSAVEQLGGLISRIIRRSNSRRHPSGRAIYQRR